MTTTTAPTTDPATRLVQADERGRSVLVIGGGSGIGRATALDYAARGARVAVLGRTADSIEATVQMITDGGAGNDSAGTARAWVADVLDDDGLGQAVRSAADWLSGRTWR